MITANWKVAIFYLFVLSLSVVGCSESVPAALPSLTPPPTYTPYPTFTAVATYTPYPTIRAIAAVPAVFYDTFSDELSGWEREAIPEGSIDYDDGTYRIIVEHVPLWIISLFTRSYEDVSIAADIVSLDGPSDAEVGIMCRANNKINGYAFTYKADGNYAIHVVIDGETRILSNARSYQISPLIHTGNSQNQIAASCIGETLIFYINGVEVYAATDNTFGHGDVGLIGGTNNLSGTDVRFDNFTAFLP